MTFKIQCCACGAVSPPIYTMTIMPKGWSERSTGGKPPFVTRFFCNMHGGAA